METLQTNIYVTGKCNKSCAFCYYPKSSLIMSDYVIEAVSKWIRKVCIDYNVQYHMMHILGGEPMMVFDVVKKLITSVKSELPKHTKGIPWGHIVIFTNADYITHDMFDWLKSNKIYIAYNPTYDLLETIHHKIHNIKQRLGGCTLSIVADDVNLPRLPHIARLAVDHKCAIRINRLYHGGRNSDYIRKFGDQMHKVFDILLEHDPPIWPNFILESTLPLWEKPSVPHACGKFFVAIDPDGSIRTCNADLDTYVGNVFETEWKDIKFTHRWSAKNLPECQSCEWSRGGYCCGGCPYTRKLAYGTYDKPTPFCSVYKELFPRLKELTDKYRNYYKGRIISWHGTLTTQQTIQ